MPLSEIILKTNTLSLRLFGCRQTTVNAPLIKYCERLGNFTDLTGKWDKPINDPSWTENYIT